MKRLILMLFSIVLVLAITIPAAAISTVSVKSIKLDKSAVTLKIGQTYSLKAAFTPANTTNKRLTYVTDNKNVATVDAKGKITGVKTGTATITVVTSNKKISAKCKVTIAPPDKPVTLEWVVEPTQIADKYKQFITDPFTFKNPLISINIVPTADYDRVTRTRLAAGDGPDVFNQDSPAVASDYWDNGQLLDLTKYAEEYGWKDKLLPWAYQAALSNGKMFTLPTEFETSCMLYNVDMFKKYGWKIPNNLDEFIKLCDDITKKGIQPVALGTRDAKYPYRWFSTGVLTAMANKDVVDVLQGKKNLTDPAIKKGFDLQLDLYKKGYFGQDFIQMSVDDSRAMFSKGQSAMIFGGCFLFGDINKMVAGSFNWDWFQLKNWGPGNTGGSPYPIAIGEVLSINAKTKYPDQAAKFADFFIGDKSDAVYHIIGANGYYMAPIYLKASDFSGRLLQQSANVFTAMDEAMKNNEVGYAMWGSWPNKTATYIRDNFERVYTGELTVDEYLAEAQKVLDDDRANKKVPKLFFEK